MTRREQRTAQKYRCTCQYKCRGCPGWAVAGVGAPGDFEGFRAIEVSHVADVPSNHCLCMVMWCIQCNPMAKYTSQYIPSCDRKPIIPNKLSPEASLINRDRMISDLCWDSPTINCIHESSLDDPSRRCVGFLSSSVQHFSIPLTLLTILLMSSEAVVIRTTATGTDVHPKR